MRNRIPASVDQRKSKGFVNGMSRKVACEQLEQRLLLSYAPLGSPVNVAGVTLGTQVIGSSRTVSADNSGNYRVVWVDSVRGLQTRLFDFDGFGLGPVKTVDANRSDIQPTVAMNDAGDYVVAWTASNQVFVERFAADGTPLGRRRGSARRRSAMSFSGRRHSPALPSTRWAITRWPITRTIRSWVCSEWRRP